MKRNLLLLMLISFVQYGVARAEGPINRNAITITGSNPYIEGFEGYQGTTYYEDGVIPEGWTRYSQATTPPHIINRGGYYYVHSGANTLFIKGEDYANSYIGLPIFSNDLSTLQVSFWMRTSSNYGTLSLGYITEGDNNYDTYQVIEEYANHTGSMEEHITYLSNIDGLNEAVRLVFRWEHQRMGLFHCCIDDVEVSVSATCLPVGTLTYSDLASSTVRLSWLLNDDTQTAWQVCVNDDEDHLVEANSHEDFLLEGLAPETDYTIKVRANCGDGGFGEWSNEVTFATLETCPTPQNLAVTGITKNSAELNWTGSLDVESYTVRYREVAYINGFFLEGFEDCDNGELPGGWTQEGQGVWTTGVGDGHSNTGTHSGTRNALIFHSNASYLTPTYLITPTMDLSGEDELVLSFWYVNRSYTNDIDGFGVYYRVYGGEWEKLWATDEAHPVWTEQKVMLKGLAADYQIGFRMTDNYGWGIGLDDVTIGAYLVPVSDWLTGTTTSTDFSLTNLIPGTGYEVQVKSDCDENRWSDAISFFTLAGERKVFYTAGEWGNPDNWQPRGVPTLGDQVVIRANATITGEAAAKKITFEGFPLPTLTIADGGKLKTNHKVMATVKKYIAAYPSNLPAAGYHLIASPLDGMTDCLADSSNYASNLITDNGGQTFTYDFYRWDPAPSDDNEWRNFRDESFYMNNGKGYLYASKNGTMINFVGMLRANNLNEVITPIDTVYNSAWNGWRLIGNPYMCDVYLTTGASGMAFYKMNAAGDGFETSMGAVAPMEGFFVKATAPDQTFTISRTAPVNSIGALNISLTNFNTRNSSVIDNAIVRFDGGNTLEKFSFRDNSSRIYFQMEDADYAVVNGAQVGNVNELPLCFEAEKNGTYMLNFSNEEVAFNYLHLIDNQTGTDVNLLEEPNYRFKARTTDYASRFRLVFAQGSSVEDNDSFGFINHSDNFCIYGLEGEATLQVVDMTGRVLSSETFYNSVEKKINATPGVYMIRLIEGSDVKVQKVVIK